MGVAAVNGGSHAAVAAMLVDALDGLSLQGDRVNVISKIRRKLRCFFAQLLHAVHRVAESRLELLGPFEWTIIGHGSLPEQPRCQQLYGPLYGPRAGEAAEKSPSPSDVGLVAAAMHGRLVNADDFVIGLDDTRAQIAAGIRRRRLARDRHLRATLSPARVSCTAHRRRLFTVWHPANKSQIYGAMYGGCWHRRCSVEADMAKKRRSSSKRDTVRRKGAVMYAKRTARGRFKDMDEKGRSLAADRRRRRAA